MNRRAFIGGATVGLLAAPHAILAQPATRKVARIGILGLATTAELIGPHPKSRSTDAFLRGLRELGYVYGEHFVTEARGAEARPERFPALVADPEPRPPGRKLHRTEPSIGGDDREATRAAQGAGAGSGDGRGALESLEPPQLAGRGRDRGRVQDRNRGAGGRAARVRSRRPLRAHPASRGAGGPESPPGPLRAPPVRRGRRAQALGLSIPPSLRLRADEGLQ